MTGDKDLTCDNLILQQLLNMIILKLIQLIFKCNLKNNERGSKPLIQI